MPPRAKTQGRPTAISESCGSPDEKERRRCTAASQREVYNERLASRPTVVPVVMRRSQFKKNSVSRLCDYAF